MTDGELLPCPFCGGRASYKGMEYDRNWITCQVVCMECESSTKRVTELTWKDAEDKVRELWNRRCKESKDAIDDAELERLLEEIIERHKGTLESLAESDRELEESEGEEHHESKSDA